jgi:hypothetical protein
MNRNQTVILLLPVLVCPYVMCTRHALLIIGKVCATFRQPCLPPAGCCVALFVTVTNGRQQSMDLETVSDEELLVRLAALGKKVMLSQLQKYRSTYLTVLRNSSQAAATSAPAPTAPQPPTQPTTSTPTLLTLPKHENASEFIAVLYNTNNTSSLCDFNSVRPCQCSPLCPGLYGTCAHTHSLSISLSISLSLYLSLSLSISLISILLGLNDGVQPAPPDLSAGILHQLKPFKPLRFSKFTDKAAASQWCSHNIEAMRACAPSKPSVGIA